MEHDAHGRTYLVDRCGRHQCRGLSGGEVVGEFLGFSCHDKVRFGGFPPLTLQNPVDLGKLVRRDAKVETVRLVAKNPDFRKELMLTCLVLLALLTFDFVPVLFTRNVPFGASRRARQTYVFLTITFLTIPDRSRVCPNVSSGQGLSHRLG